ncbi:MAG: PaaI family thioesterase, partial [Rhodospirillaceae bacterium]
IPRVMQVATLDLRIDYLRPALPRVAIKAEADCYRLSNNIAFVRGRAYQEADREIASGLATFMLDSSAL